MGKAAQGESEIPFSGQKGERMYKKEKQEGRETMGKEEFEDLISQALSDRDFEIIETVYLYHPAIRDVSGKEELAELYKSFGMTIFYDLVGRAKRNQDLADQLRQTQAETDRIKEEIIQNRASMGLVYSRMLDKLAEVTPQSPQSDTDDLQRVDIIFPKDISSATVQIAIDGHIISITTQKRNTTISHEESGISLRAAAINLVSDMYHQKS